MLPSLYSTVIVPEKVYDELIEGLRSKNLKPDLPWLVVRQVSSTSDVKNLLLSLDEGEAQAIVLSQELKADLLLIDEQAGRQIARNLGLRTTGLLGVLIEAKSKSLIPAIRPILEKLKPWGSGFHKSLHHISFHWLTNNLWKMRTATRYLCSN